MTNYWHMDVNSGAVDIARAPNTKIVIQYIAGSGPVVIKYGTTSPPTQQLIETVPGGGAVVDGDNVLIEQVSLSTYAMGTFKVIPS